MGSNSLRICKSHSVRKFFPSGSKTSVSGARLPKKKKSFRITMPASPSEKKEPY